MIVFPTCKINLGLRIISKRPDGFHNIDSLFIPLPLSDVLEIVEGGVGCSLTVSGNAPDCLPESNLVYKAWHLLNEKKKLPPTIVRLHKIIPFGAGLGGGSSDAAFTLTALNHLLNLGYNIQKLEEMAALLGSDCPFFVNPGLMHVQGRGEKFKPIQIPSLSGLWIVVIHPGFVISTALAYKNIIPRKRDNNLEDLITSPVEEWKYSIENDFEQPLFNIYPELATIKKSLYNAGALYASMSGSGSALYGLFDFDPELAFIEQPFVWKSKL